MNRCYMIYDFKCGLCWDGWSSRELAQQEIDEWDDKNNYDLHIIPTTDAEDEESADVLIYSLWGRDNHFTTVADFTDDDMINDDLVEGFDENYPVRIWNM